MKIEKKYRKDQKGWRWGFDITISGQRIRRYEWRRKQDAIDAVSALFERNRALRYGMASPDPKTTLKELQDKLSKDRSLAQRNPMLRVFGEFVKTVKPDTAVIALTRTDWKKCLDHIANRKLQPGTLNQYLSRVSSALHRAGDYFPDLAEWRPPQAPWLSEPPGRERLLSNQEVSKLL